MNVNGVRQDRDEGDKDLLLFARLPRHAKISTRVRVQTPAAIFSRSCPRKAFLLSNKVRACSLMHWEKTVLAESTLVRSPLLHAKIGATPLRMTALDVPSFHISK